MRRKPISPADPEAILYACGNLHNAVRWFLRCQAGEIQKHEVGSTYWEDIESIREAMKFYEAVYKEQTE